MKKYDCTILVNSCDKYQDILDIFFELLHRFWPDIPFDIALSTETLEYESAYFKIKNIHPRNKDCSWTERIADALKKISSNYILLMLDDMFLYDYVQTEKVLENLAILKENPQIVNFTYWPIINNSEECNYPGFKKRKKIADYKVAAIISLWNKNQFLKYVNGYKENIWEFEPNATKRSNTKYKKDEFYISKDFPKKIFPYDFSKYGLFSGKWFKSNKELFDQLNIKIDFKKRGFYNETDRGLTKSFASSFKLKSYIIPNYNLTKNIPEKQHKEQGPGCFLQEYTINGAKDMIYWCISDQCGFGITQLKIKVVYKDKSSKIINNKILFGNFKRMGKIFIFNNGVPCMYIPTYANKVINKIEISGVVNVPLKKWQLKYAYNKKTEAKLQEFKDKVNEVNKEIYLVKNLISCVTLNPITSYYIADKYIEDDILEFEERNTKDSFSYKIKLKPGITALVWQPSLQTGYSIKDLNISYTSLTNEMKSINEEDIEGLPQYIDRQYAFLVPTKIKVNLPEKDIKEVKISGRFTCPIKKEILAYLLNGTKRKHKREGK